MKSGSNEIPVVAHLFNGKSEYGVAIYDTSGPYIQLDNGEKLDDSNEILFELANGASRYLPLQSNELVVLRPTFQIQMKYSSSGIGTDYFYPPSTNNWITHAAGNEDQALYVVQDIHNADRKLLTIVPHHESNEFKAFKVFAYETTLLTMKRDLIASTELLKEQKESPELYAALENKKPTWELLGKLVEDITIPNLTLKPTMEETLEQLVPKSFPQIARKQIMAFLSWLDTAAIPSDDPVEFRQKFGKATIFCSLVSGHLRCLLDGVKPPPYVRIMMLANAGQLSLTERPPPIEFEKNPWFLAQYRLYELFPDWMDRVLTIAEELNNKGEIITELPISKQEAQKSREAWSNRFALSSQGLLMRGHVQKDVVGLKTLVYVGSAHKWPHKHLEFSARLGFQQDRSSQIQVMVVPPSVVERVTRLFPNIHAIDWEMNASNLSLYNFKARNWKINSTLIYKSLERKRSIKQLKNEFGSLTTKMPVKLTKNQAVVLDMISWLMYLQHLEYGRYSEYYNLETAEIQRILNELRNMGVFKLSYLMEMQKLASIFVSAKGPSNHVCSLSRAFLKHAPTADVRITNEGSSSFIISRVPEDESFKLLTTLPSIASEHEVNLKAYPISAYIGYRNNLYQRLLKEDRSWDDDVSDLLSQARLRSKDEV